MLQNALKIIDAGDMSGNVTSSTLDCGDGSNVGIELHAATGTHVGTVAVHGSNTGTKWNAITLTKVPNAASGSAFDAVVSLADFPFRYLRLVYTAGSGTGSLDAVATVKG